MASIVDMFAADGAADEQLASRMLHKCSARAALGHALPNLSFVVRDKPHIARRLLQRSMPKDRFRQQTYGNIALVSRLFGHARATLGPTS